MGGEVPAPWLVQQEDSVSGASGCCGHFWATDGVASGSLPSAAMRCLRTLCECWVVRADGIREKLPEGSVCWGLM